MGTQPPPILYKLGEGVNYLTLRGHSMLTSATMGEMLNPNPNDCNSTITSATRGFLLPLYYNRWNSTPVQNLSRPCHHVGLYTAKVIPAQLMDCNL